MKTSPLLVAVFASLSGISLWAQQTGADASGDATASVHDSAGTSAEVDTHQGAVGFGDEAQSHAWEMSSVNGELQGKLDSKTARVGDPVVLKTTEKVITPDGTTIPKGARLLGHVTEAQAHDAQHGASQLAIAFDHAQLKNGEKIAVHTLIRGVRPGASAMSMTSSDTGMGSPMGGGMGGMSGGGMSGGGIAGGGMGTGRAGGGGGGGVLGGTGRAAGGVSNTADDTIDRTAETTPTLGAGAASATDSTVQTAGHGDLGANENAHTAAMARAIPHPTGIPGVMLAGSSSASGVFSAPRGEVKFDNGTQMHLGIIADR